jgi:predicted DNA-binding transcriptional regulator AlpA
MAAELLTTRETAELLRLAITTLEHWRLEGRGPHFLRLSSRQVRYRRTDVDRWLAETNEDATGR